MAFLGYTVILLVEKILFDNQHEHKDKHSDKEFIEMEKLNNNEAYKSPDVKLFNINNNFNISLESIIEQPDHKDNKFKTTKELKSPFPHVKKRNTKISSHVWFLII
jgi:hypothetical protein